MSNDSLSMTAAVNVDDLFDNVARQVRELITTHRDQVPVYTEHGRWHFEEDAWAPAWTSGFLAGQIWAVAERTGDPWWRDQAERYSILIEPRRFDSGTHDIGFLFTPSWGRWHRLAPTDRSRQVLIDAGRTLASSFNPAGKYLRTWVDAGSTFIDIMMNVDIIYQAAELSGDSSLADIATAHALTSRRYLVRGDASTVHEGWFNAESGEFLRTATHQGWRADSCWARGHAWAIYGFGDCYRRTGDQRFLDTAIRCADLYIDKTGDRLVPPNDWDDPNPEFPYEASAASVAAAGMLRLANLLSNAGDRYRDYGSRIVERLSEPDFLGRADDGWEGVIKQSTYHRAHGLGVQESVMWGDYYYVEALEEYSRVHPT